MLQRREIEALPRWHRPLEVDRFAQALAELYPAAQRSSGDWIEECEAMHVAWNPVRPVTLRGNGVDLLLALIELG